MMKNLFNFVHKYIMPMFVVFCSTAHGMEIETKDYSREPNSLNAIINDETSSNLKAILDEKETTEIEDLFKSADCEMYWIKIQCSSHNKEIIEDAYWRIRRESPVGLNGGKPFISFLNECQISTNISGEIKEALAELSKECDSLGEKCNTLEDKKNFIIKCCVFVTGLRYYLPSH